MATKLQLISELACDTSKGISSINRWSAFLNTAAWQYKYSFEDQVLIFAQRPNARACADFDTWNNTLNRRIKRGAKGIALLRERGNKYYLDYVFDVADTYSTQSKKLNLWQYDRKYDNAIIETLGNTFGDLRISTNITDAIICAAHNAVEDNKADYLTQLKYVKLDSFLSDLDEINLDVEFQQTAEVSIAYMIMQRMGLNPSEYFELSDFRFIVDFNTVETMSVIGNAVSEISEQALREISSTITAEIKKERIQAKIFAENQKTQYNDNSNITMSNNDERTDENDRDNLYQRERDTDSELGSTTQRQADRQIRNDEEEISENIQTEPLLSNDDTRNIDGTSLGDRPNSEETSRGNGTANGENREYKREAESRESDDVGRTYEQPQTLRRRSSPQTVGAQLSLFDVFDESNIQDDMQREAERLNNIRPAFSISQQIIDEVLCDGGNEENSKKRICSEFSKQKSLTENAEFLRNEYKRGGKGFELSGEHISVWFDEGGIKIQQGRKNTENGYTLSWENAAQRIDELLNMGRYMPQAEINDAKENEIKELAQKIVSLFQDSEKNLDIGIVDQGSYLSTAEDVITSLKSLDYQETLIRNLHNFSESLNNGNAVLRYPSIHNLSEIIKAVEELKTPRKEYTATEYNPFEGRKFITENEIDSALMRGSGMSEGKMRIASFFLNETDSAKRADFLKKEYGIGGNSHAIGGVGWEDHDSKGITLSRDDITMPYDKVTVSWQQAAKRIDILMKNNQYLTEADVLHIPEYEKNQLAQSIYYAYSSVPMENYRPFPYGYDYYNAVPIVKDALDNKEKTDEMFSELKTLMMETLESDKEYKFRSEALNTLESYINGTYDLFPGIEREKQQEETTSFSEYFSMLHRDDDGKTVALFPVGDFYEAFGTDAENIAEELNFHLTRREIDETIYPMVGFPKYRLEENINVLNYKGFDVIITDENRNSYKVISTEKALGTVTEDISDTTKSAEENLAEMFDVTAGEIREQVTEEYEKVQRRYSEKTSPSHLTLEQRNYLFMEEFAPQILNGNSYYMRFSAGESFMPLVIENNGNGRISVTHTYELNGDLCYDPDMTFAVDNEERTLSARSFEQSIPPIYQEADEGDNLNQALIEQLNSFSADWFKNIKAQGYYLEQITVPYHDDEIEIRYDKEGNVIRVNGEVNLVEMYKEEHGIVIKEVTQTLDEPTAPEVSVSTLIGTEIAIDDRKFVVDSIDEISGSASLKDITFQGNVGFPIFRRESIDFVKAALAEQTEQSIVPEFEKIKPSKAANTVVYPEIPMVHRHNFVIDNDELGFGSPKEKFRKNMEAIRVLKECEFEHRLATPEEQQILSQYVGWGGLSDAFDETKSTWTDEFTELYTTLSPEEYEDARASTLNAHYTSPTIIKSMYKALENMGFTQGNILEPACGIGNFMGLVPESMSDSKIYGIELDSITGRIAQQLYQRNSIAIQGFEDTTLPDSFFDVAIGNVPFGDYKLNDKKYNKHNFLIHDYFFAKTLDKVRPGGIVAFITSSGTMDKRNSKVRQYIAQRADLVGAIRLPNNAFLKNAGTEVTADILFLQKRDRMIDIMPDWVNLATLENGITVNQYFADNPDMILGKMEMVSGPFGPTPTCIPYEEADLSQQLNDAIQNIHASITDYEVDDISNDEDLSIPADPNVKNFSFTLVDGDVYFRENSAMRKVDLNATALNRIKGMINIRDCMRDLIEYQTEGYSDFEIKKQQEKLNTLYDDFTKKYGLINSRGNSMAFSDDSSYFLLCSLEILDENGELERKADMFTKRTIGAKQEVTKVDTASEALAVSLGEKAKIDMEFMSQLSGKTEDELYNDLLEVIFLNPLYESENQYFPKYITADEYLSGNVREKLRIAKASAQTDERFNVNVEALSKVQPKDLSASEITVRLGSTWIPPEYIEEFIFELLSPGWYARDKIKVTYSNITGEWNISNKSYDKGVKAVNTFGTHRINAYKIIEESLNLKDVRIFDYVENENGSKVAVLNKKETTIAQQKQDLIKAEFDNWIWRDPSRRETLTKLYNEKFNSTRPREYDGGHLTFSGMNPEIVLRKHQQNAVARIMYGGNSLLGHVVGAGKTWTMVAAAMECKRLGLCNKSLFVVPNHLTEQWASEFLQLYPAANILVATKKDFETKNRKKFCGRIATGDYDAVIIGHSQFEKIPMSVERQRAILERQLKEIMDGIVEAKANRAERFTVKQLEKSKKSIQIKLDKLNDQSRKDDVVTFEELGVDRVFVDEAHYYKNLYLYTKMRNVGGIAQTEAQKSSDLFMKTQYLDEITGGKGIIFATGTPVSNSMVELYTMQRYLQYNTLREKNLQHFDAWASTFGETITAIELAPEGTGYRAKTRFAKFFNLPELMAMFKDVADIQTADMLNLPTPTPHYKTIAVEPTEIQKEMVSELADRAEKVRNKMVDPSEDNMLTITNDGRKLALDQRLINPILSDDENSKVSTCAKEVFKIWEETKSIKGTQLVFCDLSTPKNDGTFNVYTDIKDKLIARGIPEKEIEFIHNADTEVKKKDLFSKVRKGDVRILLGSTPKMGAGTNVQKLLYASHDLDCPWRPADLEQRAGRIIRQGNTNSDVHIYRYVTKDTFDSYMWVRLEVA